MSVLTDLAARLRLSVRMPPALRLRAVVAQGPAGRDGERGPPGVSAASLDFEQGAPALVWTIVHGFGRHPSVTVVDTAGDPILVGPTYPDRDTVRLTFSAPTAGFAYLN